MTYTIDKKVPLPHLNENGRTEKYPLSQMAVGDSFRFEWDAALRSTIRSSAFQRWKHTRRFVTKAVVEDGKRWFRIWRVK